MTNEHTKVPWHVSYNISEQYSIGIRSKHGDFLCMGHHCRPITSKCLANYQFLIKAVNSHEKLTKQRDQLLTALENLLRELDHGDYPTHTGMVLAFKDQARVAIESTER